VTGGAVAVVLFWIAAASLVTGHVAVPLALRALRPWARRRVDKRAIEPTVSVVISASNEERHIAAKIEDCLRFDYPADRLEILVVSDGSTDRTNAILAQVRDPRVRVQVLDERLGKANAQNIGAQLARHEVLFFTDATTTHPPDVLRRLLPSLADPGVGCASGRPVFRTDTGGVSRGAETRFAFEMQSRDALGSIYSLLGAQDCVYAVPKALYRPVRPDLDGGFVGPLLILEAGHRTIYEPEALAFVDRPAPDLGSEFARRSRIVLRGMRGILALRRLLNPFTHPALASALVFTRLLRWLTPLFLAVLLLSNLALLDRAFYRFALTLQAFFYALALTGYLAQRARLALPAVLALPFYFCLLSASAAAGLWRLLRGESGQTWQTLRETR
jgi:glycosyltransferase involved in cell wall biosynthesis